MRTLRGEKRRTCPFIKGEVVRERLDCFPLGSYAVSVRPLRGTKYPVSGFEGTILWDWGIDRNLPSEFFTERERKRWLYLIFTQGL